MVNQMIFIIYYIIAKIKYYIQQKQFRDIVFVIYLLLKQAGRSYLSVYCWSGGCKMSFRTLSLGGYIFLIPWDHGLYDVYIWK